MAKRKGRYELSDDDRRVWLQVAKTVQSTGYSRGASDAIPSLDDKARVARREPTEVADPAKQSRRHAAASRPSKESLLDLITDSATKMSHSPAVSVTRPLDNALAPGALQDIDRRTATRLKQGRFALEGRLDLHGMTRDVAFDALHHFVISSAKAGKRCVLLVTGKGVGQRGGGVLRAEAPTWLNLPQNRKYIVGFTYASPKDGGTGALYLYLRRPNRVKT